MEIYKKIFKFKHHISFAVALSLVILSLLYLAPSFIGLIAYFWPLLVSTAMFLAAIVLFGRTSPTAAAEKAGEGLLDYVACQNEPELAQSAEEEESFEKSSKESFESEQNK